MKILLTGANGYIGKLLLPVLVRNKHKVYCLVRDKRRFNTATASDNIEVISGDLLKPDSLVSLPKDIDAAYYLVHSMTSGDKNFDRLEEDAAHNFSNYIRTTTAKQIIYLGGLVNAEHLSKHLRSRKNVESVLKESGVSVTVLRAGIIIGSGSASFEIIRDLVEKLPVMITPRWLNTKNQPIAIANVLDYLAGVLGNEAALGRTFDIGGPEPLTYRQMLLEFAKIRGIKRYIITLPLLSPRLSSYWLYFVTSTSFQLAKNLVESLKTEAICRDDSIKKIIDVPLLTYRESVQRAFRRVEQNAVVSSWKDAVISEKMSSQLSEFIQVPVYGCVKDQRITPFTTSEEKVLDKVWTIGGANGWYYANFLWRIRGFIDKLAGGVGLRRGRRSATELNVGDALDFWRVLLADKESKRLLLYAEMKLPGEAWLEFSIINLNGQNQLVQTATFRPRGLAGRAYWYGLLPLHNLIFEGMARKIVAG